MAYGKRDKPVNEYQRRGRQVRGGFRPRRKSWLRTYGPGVVVLGLLVAVEVGPSLAGCDVKGNISPNTGERIYHVPGQEYYWQTRINWLAGERWFCSEDSARAAGWRRAKH